VNTSAGVFALGVRATTATTAAPPADLAGGATIVQVVRELQLTWVA
jgi:hypothetical protein